MPNPHNKPPAYRVNDDGYSETQCPACGAWMDMHGEPHNDLRFSEQEREAWDVAFLRKHGNPPTEPDNSDMTDAEYYATESFKFNDLWSKEFAAKFSCVGWVYSEICRNTWIGSPGGAQKHAQCQGVECYCRCHDEDMCCCPKPDETVPSSTLAIVCPIHGCVHIQGIS